MSFKDIIKINPDVLETYGQYPLDNDYVYLSDRQVLKILTIIRQNWGKHKVTANVKGILKERKQLVAHLFALELLDKNDPIHFVGRNDEPVSR